MARLFGTIGTTLDSVQEGAEYVKDRISVLRYDAIADNYKEWYTTKRSPLSIPPHMREGYIAYCKSLKSKVEQGNEEND